MADSIVQHTSDCPGHTLSTGGEQDVFSSQWTSSSLKALGPIATDAYPPDRPYDTQTNYPSIPLTPGEKFPGAYPRNPADPSALSQDVDYVKGAAAHAFETAKEYAYYAGEAVGGYLPKSVAAYLPHSSSKVEESRADEIGDPDPEELPGPPGEFLGDAQVPDDLKLSPASGGHADERRPEDVHTLLHGVGIPGKSYPNVDDHHSTTASSRLQGASENASTRSLPGSRMYTWSPTPSTSMRGSSLRNSLKNTEDSDDIREQGEGREDNGAGFIPLPSSPTTTGREHSTMVVDHHHESPILLNRSVGLKATDATAKQENEYHFDDKPATLTSDQSEKPSPAVNASVSQPEEATAASTSTHRASAASTNTTTSTPSKSRFGSRNTKPGFMDKLRGEIKIISGKLENSNDKIEEGRRLMGKAPKTRN